MTVETWRLGRPDHAAPNTTLAPQSLWKRYGSLSSAAMLRLVDFSINSLVELTSCSEVTGQALWDKTNSRPGKNECVWESDTSLTPHKPNG